MREEPQDAGRNSTALRRAFVALRMPAHVCAALAAAQDRLRLSGAPVGWTLPNDFHLTLWFIGDVSKEWRGALCRALDELAGRTPPFEFEIAGAGYFGPPRAPRVLWAGVAKMPAPMKTLTENLRNWGRAQGWAVEERAFCAHVTLGRVREPRRLDVLTASLASLSSTTFGRVTAESIALMASADTPQNSRYVVTHESPLKG